MEAVELQAQMRHWVDQGVTHLNIEASSIGLKESRMDGTRIEVAIFTNFTQDHLDYHGDMADYWQAKMILFERLNPKASVVNVDDPKGQELYRKLKSDGLVVLGYSKNSDASSHVELRAQNLKVRELNALYDSKGEHSTALSFEVVYQSKAHSFELPVLGDFNVSNLLAVLGALLALGYDIKQALGACAALSPAPGRMQTLHVPEAPLVVIDYAHTPDGIEKALSSLKRISLAREGQLWCVMGCGGERDEGKRPVMGALTESLADQVVLTSDNPRGEDPQRIIDQIREGFKNPKLPQTHLDRRDAIHMAISQAAKNDVVLIAGKGHESYQDIKGHRHLFSDTAVALEFLSERSRTSNKGALHVH
jgi:UDP-N-acetylmuramoyl-L-alanyl-D-glutamate--2,6-diaminopimelate ligase